MPTGYTADIAKGISFQSFALQCARNFGALITMRDEPANTPIPEEFQPSDYNKNRLSEALSEIDKLDKLSADECADQSRADYERQLAYHHEKIKEDVDLRAKYLAMLAQVESWNPPSEDHEEMKKFMIQQITGSIEFDCGGTYHQEAIKNLKHLSGQEWKQAQIEKSKKDIADHTKAHKEECERTSSRNEWVRKLRESLPA